MRTVALAFLLSALTAAADTRITLVHFSDYHSHALPFATDEGERGGIARAIAYLRKEKQAGALVFSGGDTINKGAPAWSDKYGCVEWPWFNGIVDAMAFGNHEADYGFEAFERCRAAVTYPILGANTSNLPATAVFRVRGVRVGVFAVAGPDFASLVKVPELAFSDSVAAARTAVDALRREERVDVVVMIGHQAVSDDEQLARAVPGIDLIFGTHSHLKRELTRIAETSTWFISPSQYLSYISRVELTVGEGRLKRIDGRLVPVDERMPVDRRIARRVRGLQRDLERDPQYRELFAPIGRLPAGISTQELALMTVDAMREATQADVAISTQSSFRRPLSKGTLTLEQLRGALPYDNEIVTCAMTGAQLRTLLDAAGGQSYVVGADRIDPSKNYRVATTDYVAFVAFKKLFACEGTRTGLRAREELRKRLVSVAQ